MSYIDILTEGVLTALLEGYEYEPYDIANMSWHEVRDFVQAETHQRWLDEHIPPSERPQLVDRATFRIRSRAKDWVEDWKQADPDGYAYSMELRSNRRHMVIG